MLEMKTLTALVQRGVMGAAAALIPNFQPFTLSPLSPSVGLRQDDHRAGGRGTEKRDWV